MAHEDGVLQVQFASDLDHIVGIAGKRRILAGIVGRKIGAAGADMVEQHDLEVPFELRRHEPPHVLIAAEAVGEDHGSVAGATDVHVVPFDYACHWGSSFQFVDFAGISISLRVPNSQRRRSGAAADRGAPGQSGRCGREGRTDFDQTLVLELGPEFRGDLGLQRIVVLLDLLSASGAYN